MKTRMLVLIGTAALVVGGCSSKGAVKGGDASVQGPAPVAAPADAPVLAVTAVQAQNVEKAEAAIVTDIIRSEIMALGKWRVIDRERMDELLKGQALAMAGVASDAEAVSLGKLLNAQLIGLGTYGTLMGANVVTYRIVNVETGLAIHAGTAQGKDIAGLRAEVSKMVKNFAR